MPRIKLPPIPIDPLVDPVFKALFGTEANKDILMSFLNAVLEAVRIPLAVSIELVPPRNIRGGSEAKETEVDVRAKDRAGRVFQIEVQLDSGGPLAERMIFGAGQLYASTLSKGDSYNELKPVVSIWLLRDRLPHRPREKRRVVTDYRYRDERGHALGPYPTLVVIELKNREENVSFEMDIERWLFFFAHGKELSLSAELPPEIQSEVFMKAVSEAKRFNDSWAKRMAYESHMDRIRWNNALKELAEEQRRRDEEQRHRDEEQRQKDQKFRQETERLAREAATAATAAVAQESALREKLANVFRNLVSSGMTPEEAARVLDLRREQLPPIDTPPPDAL